MSRFRKNDGGSQNFSSQNFQSSERSYPIGRKESPLQRKPRLNGLQNNTSVQSTLRIAFINRRYKPKWPIYFFTFEMGHFSTPSLLLTVRIKAQNSQLRQYSKYSSESTGPNGIDSRNELRKRPQSKVPNRDRYSMANLFGPPTSKKRKVKAESEAEGFFLGGSASEDEDKTEEVNHEEVEKNEDEKVTEDLSSAELELKDLVKKQKLFVEEGSEKEAILKE